MAAAGPASFRKSLAAYWPVWGQGDGEVLREGVFALASHTQSWSLALESGGTKLESKKMAQFVKEEHNSRLASQALASCLMRTRVGGAEGYFFET